MNAQKSRKVKIDREINNYDELQRSLLMLDVGEVHNFHFKGSSGEIEKTIVLKRLQ